MSRSSRRLLRIFVLASTYLVTARLGLSVDPVAGFATLVWAPTGLALVALLRYGYSMWPGIALGVLGVGLSMGTPVADACGIAVGNTLEAVVGTYALRRTGFRSSLDRVQDVLALVVFGALLSTMVSATIGVGTLSLGGLVSAEGLRFSTWRTWWLGDAMANLVLVPLLLSVVPFVRELPRTRVVEVVALGASLVGVSLLVFGNWSPPQLAAFRHPYVVFPMLIWAALRFGTRGAALGTFVVVAIAIAGRVIGDGPFFGGSLSDDLFALQAFMAVLVITILVLGAASTERDDAIQKRQELLEVVSHELKNPLSIVQLSAEALLRTLPHDEARDPARKQAQRVQRASQRMEGLIRNLLDVGALELGRLEVETREEDVGSMVAEAVDSLRPLAVQKSQSLEARTDTTGVVLCDRNRVLQVIANLVGNAVKFCPAGASITVQAASRGDKILFSIRDTGPGIPPAQLSHVFERRWRARRTTEPGSGLGLFISRGLVRAQGGEMWAESDVGSGSTFHFTLPTPSPTRRSVLSPVGPSDHGRV